jgi:diaminopimelate decarboxylase
MGTYELHAARAKDRLAEVGHVYPIGTQLDSTGRLQIAGCDALELAREFGTPCYVYSEDDIRARCRAYMEAFRARTQHFEVIYASKALPMTACYRTIREEGLSCDVASGGELYLALKAGLPPQRIYMHGNNKTEQELRYALDSSVGYIVVDSFNEIDRLERLSANRSQKVMLRVTPDIKPKTHDYVQTGQVDSKFGFTVDDVPRAIDRISSVGGLELVGLHAHIGSQIFHLEPYRKLAELLAGIGSYPLLNLGGGLGIAYTADEHPPSIDEYVSTLLREAPEQVTVLCEPGRSLVGNAGVSLYTIGTVKTIPGVRTYVAVDGGMSDNLRPMLYGSRYEADVVDRLGGDSLCTVAGMHCESGDILAQEALLDSPSVGDILAMPATGAYGHAMANNYNGVPRPPIVMCSDGDARLVVRRETYEDLALRDL